MSYMAGNTTRLRVKVVGEIAGLSTDELEWQHS